jgi:hypothetical protein
VILLDPEEEEEAQSAKESPELNERDLALSEEGTGALVYDTTDYQDLLHALDASLSVSPSKGTHSSRRHTS